VHLLGMAYKRDVNDMRESPALDILELLLKRGALVTYTDPWVPEIAHAGHNLRSVPFDDAVSSGFDCALVVTDHLAFDYGRIAALPLVVDTRNALKGFVGKGLFAL
jgi:UDP-N-acetyl-D-glucosamine dehydrogenase